MRFAKYSACTGRVASRMVLCEDMFVARVSTWRQDSRAFSGLADIATSSGVVMKRGVSCFSSSILSSVVQRSTLTWLEYMEELLLQHVSNLKTQTRNAIAHPQANQNEQTKQH